LSELAYKVEERETMNEVIKNLKSSKKARAVYTEIVSSFNSADCKTDKEESQEKGIYTKSNFNTITVE